MEDDMEVMNAITEEFNIGENDVNQIMNIIPISHLAENKDTECFVILNEYFAYPTADSIYTYKTFIND